MAKKRGVPKGTPSVGGYYSNNNNTKKKGVPIWFFIDGRLHKRLRVDRSNDLLHCWDFGTQREVAYSLYAAKLKMRPCYSTKQASEFLNRYKFTLLRYVEDGSLREPAMALLPNQKRQKTTRYRWSEDDIMAARDFLATMKNDEAPAKPVPSRRELRALLNDEETLYVKGPDGNFVPTWRAKDF
jgi:hypothetical protein